MLSSTSLNHKPPGKVNKLAALHPPPLSSMPCHPTLPSCGDRLVISWEKKLQNKAFLLKMNGPHSSTGVAGFLFMMMPCRSKRGSLLFSYDWKLLS